MKTLPLTRGLKAIVDDADYEWACTEHWHANFPRKGGKPYARNGNGVYLHTKVFGASIHAQIDHRNGNTLDCRRGNLRHATPQQNKRGFRKKRSDTTSIYRGVSWFRRDRCWRAYITLSYRQKHLGYFVSEEQAARIYDAAARRYFKGFAHLNFSE